MHGSAELGHSLADAGLVDRYDLLVFPVLLGAGKRLFSDADRDTSRLRLVEYEALRQRHPAAGLRVVH